MISPSEDSGVIGTGPEIGAQIPVRLLGKASRRVSRLEFFPLDRPETAMEAAKIEKLEVLLEDEAGMSDEQLPSKVERISVDVELVRSEAKAEAQLECKRDLEKGIAEERAAVLKICEEFRRERMKYFAEAESEVVQLALAIATRVLGEWSYDAHPDGFHLWLPIAGVGGWSSSELALQLRNQGIAAVASAAFSTDGNPPNALRVCLGGSKNREECEEALRIIAETLEHPHHLHSAIM